jgi:hypothetical protein
MSQLISGMSNEAEIISSFIREIYEFPEPANMVLAQNLMKDFQMAHGDECDVILS